MSDYSEYKVEKQDVVDAIETYFKQYEIMIKDVSNYFGDDAAEELEPYCDKATELYYHLDPMNKRKMAGYNSEKLYYFATGISTYLSAGNFPQCVNRDTKNGTLKVKRDEFDKEGGWFKYFSGLSEEDQTQMIDWYNCSF